jgi:hypothetical protein
VSRKTAGFPIVAIAVALALGCDARSDYDLAAQRICLRLLADASDTLALIAADLEVYPEGQHTYLLLLEKRAVRCRPFWKAAIVGPGPQEGK